MEIQLREILMAGHAQITIGKWIPLMDYAIKKGVSLSTLRRHIKANRLTYKVEEGRYLLWDGDESLLVADSKTVPSFEQQLTQLSRDLRKAHEEIAELKTLIAFYEEQNGHARPNS